MKRPWIKPLTQADIDLKRTARKFNKYSWDKTLSQSEIDRPEPPEPSTWKKLRDYFGGIPGWIWTTVVLVCFLAGAYFMFAVWSIGQTIVSTAGRG